MTKPTPEAPDKIMVITRLFGEDKDLFEKLKAKKRQSVSEIVRRALREMAEREGVRV